jgi:hypothetical protein
MVVAVWTVSGLGAGLINPILSATIYERPGPARPGTRRTRLPAA